MVSYKNHYINLVVLGSFNPAILTHDFLIKECNFIFDVEPKVQQMPIPVVSSIEYGKVAFFADLGRLQILENSCDDPKKSSIPRYLQVYLERLPHTPLKKCGANFSYELCLKESDLNNIHSWLKNSRENILKALKLSEVGVELSFDILDNLERIKTWTIRTQVEKSGATTRAKFDHSADRNCLQVDFNFEINGLDNNKDLINTITIGYGEVFDLFKHQVESIFRG